LAISAPWFGVGIAAAIERLRQRCSAAITRAVSSSHCRADIRAIRRRRGCTISRGECPANICAISRAYRRTHIRAIRHSGDATDIDTGANRHASAAAANHRAVAATGKPAA